MTLLERKGQVYPIPRIVAVGTTIRTWAREIVKQRPDDYAAYRKAKDQCKTLAEKRIAYMGLIDLAVGDSTDSESADMALVIRDTVFAAYEAYGSPGMIEGKEWECAVEDFVTRSYLFEGI